MEIALWLTVYAKIVNSLLMKSVFSPNQLEFGKNVRILHLTSEVSITELDYIESKMIEI